MEQTTICSRFVLIFNVNKKDHILIKRDLIIDYRQMEKILLCVWWVFKSGKKLTSTVMNWKEFKKKTASIDEQGKTVVSSE